MAEFADILVTWTMLLSGLGLASILISGAFLREVVFDTIAICSSSAGTALHEVLIDCPVSTDAVS